MDTSLVLYLILAVVHIVLRSEGLRRLGSLSKILLMPLLMFYVQHHGNNELVCLALVCATLGDLLLVKGHQRPFFTAGMLIFALSHQLYMVHLLVRAQLDWTLVCIAFCLLGGALVLIIKVLHPPLRFVLYAANLFLLTALCTGTKNLLCIGGALAFIVSDGMIALDSLKKRSFHISSEMSIYLLAQLLLILGFIAL